MPAMIPKEYDRAAQSMGWRVGLSWKAGGGFWVWGKGGIYFEGGEIRICVGLSFGVGLATTGAEAHIHLRGFTRR
jgi:hypothetical protein